MGVQKLLDRLDKVIHRGDGRWYACCPAHDDKSPSLSISELDSGKILVHCFAGCSTEEVLQSVSLTFADLYPDKWEAARYRATANEGAKWQRRHLPSVDPSALDKRVLELAEADLRAGRKLSVEDQARVELALDRLGIREAS